MDRHPSGPMRQQPGPPDHQSHAITREQVLAALECSLMVLRSGDVLVIRVPGWLTQDQVQGYRRRVSELVQYYNIPNHILILPGEEFAALRPHIGQDVSLVSRLGEDPRTGGLHTISDETRPIDRM